VGQNPLSFTDPLGLSKVSGQSSIGGSDSAVSGITKNSTKAEINAAINRATDVLKDPKASPARKKFLKGWIKVAKRGFTKAICPPFLEEIVGGIACELCLMGDAASCQVCLFIRGETEDREYD
jgi:hypothetical protein